MIGERLLVDSESQIRYHEWILKELRKQNETESPEKVYIGGRKDGKSLADRHNVDSDGIKG